MEKGYRSGQGVAGRDFKPQRIREGCPKVLHYLTDVTEEEAEIAAKEQREKEKEARQEADP